MKILYNGASCLFKNLQWGINEFFWLCTFWLFRNNLQYRCKVFILPGKPSFLFSYIPQKNILKNLSRHIWNRFSKYMKINVSTLIGMIIFLICWTSSELLNISIVVYKLDLTSGVEPESAYEGLITRKMEYLTNTSNSITKSLVTYQRLFNS